ncbi:glycosyltransferase [Vibrio sp. TH_r3]|uniref:glycosyltransferase n=1 Tax=Vibrio sp. TH_r3 TaxID=3082084 RepID=UPI002952AC10|nr:glycosyltransferase [Vibrio sp. TH_r3]MDV7104207.1 glycosyltransferase [Vibrio sp. TH_r3]
MALVIDITTLKKWNRYPVGITRTLLEFVNFSNENLDVKFVFFSDDKSEIVECEQYEVDSILERLNNGLWEKENRFKLVKKEIIRKYSLVRLILTFIKELKGGNFRVVARAVYHRSPGFIKYIARNLYLLKKSNISILESNVELNEKINFHEEEISRDRSIPISEGDIFVSIGLDWDFSNYRLLYEYKNEIRFEVVTCFYDAIPVTHPELVHSDYFGKVFYTHIYNLVHLSDKIFCISKYSEKILIDMINKQDMGVMPDVKTIHLGGDIDNNKTTSLSLSQDNYVLFVSTIEARKNHKLLLDVWEELIEKRGETTPKLILVGMHGWGVDDFFKKYNSEKKFSEFIEIRNSVSDSELSKLYSQCKFCVFPSIVEGWGLSASEALSYGKVCLISEAPSLKEATQSLMPVLQNDPIVWTEKIGQLLDDEDYLKNLELDIKNKFEKRSWERFSKDFVSFILNKAQD